jgi:hypothetical protein
MGKVTYINSDLERILLTQKTKEHSLFFESLRYKIMNWWEEIIAVFNTGGLMV